MGRKRQATGYLIRGCAVAAVLVALFLLDLHEVRREPPLVRIGTISPVMNFKTVRVEGLLLSDAKRLAGGAAYFLVADQTGSLPVFLESEIPDELPSAGYRIAATGRLSVGAGNQRRLRVLRRDGITVLENVGPITLKGRVVEVRIPPPGSNAPHKLILSTPGGAREVVHWFDTDTPIAVGDMLEVVGAISSYRGRLQVEVRDASGMRHQPDG